MAQFNPTRVKASFFLVLLTISTTQLTNAQFTKLFGFTRTVNIQYPANAQFVSDGTWLYASVGNQQGESPVHGILFKVKPDGTGYTELKDFGTTTTDGTILNSPVILSDDVLYGKTYAGGATGFGYIYSIHTDGTGFRTLLPCGLPGNGADPQGITISDNVGYGMTYEGGAYNIGCIFKINTDGTGFVTLKGFVAEDGTRHLTPLIAVVNTLYGTTNNGGVASDGTIFKYATTSGEFSKLWDFASQTGSQPSGSLVYALGKLYGVTHNGGAGNKGVVLSLAITTDPTKLEDLANDNDIKIYPNPFGDYIVIESTKSYTYVSVLDLNGKLITEITTKGQLRNTIPLKKLEVGTYIMLLKDNDHYILMEKRVEKTE